MRAIAFIPFMLAACAASPIPGLDSFGQAPPVMFHSSPYVPRPADHGALYANNGVTVRVVEGPNLRGVLLITR